MLTAKLLTKVCDSFCLLFPGCYYLHFLIAVHFCQLHGVPFLFPWLTFAEAAPEGLQLTGVIQRLHIQGSISLVGPGQLSTNINCLAAAAA